MKKLLTFALSLMICLNTAFAVSIQTQIGEIKLPDAKEINEAIVAVDKDKSLTEENKKELLNLYKSGLDNLDQIKSIEAQQKELDLNLQNANHKIQRLANTFSSEQKLAPLTKDQVDALSEKDLDLKLDKAKQDLITSQLELNSASDMRNKVQTLPEQAQNTITANNEKVKSLLGLIDEDNNVDSLKNRVYALLIYKANLENALFKEELANISTLQDISNYNQKIAAAKTARIESNVKALSLKKNLEFNQEDEKALNKKIAKKSPELSKVVDELGRLSSYVAEYRTKNAQYQHDYQEVDSALTKVDQIQKNLTHQIQELGKTLVLSRLLNKQLSMLPTIELSYDLDEVIANQNIYIYDIREQSEKLIDVEEYVENKIASTPALTNFKTDLITLYSQKRRLLNDLYQIMADGLNNSIGLKVKYTSYTTISNKIRSDISEQLFWVKSNQAISKEFFNTLGAFTKYEAFQLYTKVTSDKFLKHTAKTFIYVVLPFIILALISLIFNPLIKKNNNDLAQRLDKASDNIFVTPFAILNNVVMMLPSLSWMVVLGSVIICTSLATLTKQYHIILTMVMHIFVFMFFLQIIKPNALVQRHFSMPPYKLAQYRGILNQIWLCALPLLIFANVAEADSNVIYADITSFVVVLLSFTLLFIISLRSLIKAINDVQGRSATAIFSWFISMLVCLAAVGFVASGYLYSIVTLTNRLAYTCYIILAYFLVSQTIHRMMHVYITKSLNKKRAKHKHTESEQTLLTSMSMSPDKLTAKAYKIVNVCLISIAAFFMYLQWNDLASVLRYLNTIQLWTNEEYINGTKVVTDYLSLANILFAIFILVITSVLNKNLPVILERLMLLKKGVNQKSTSYTVKVIVSYLIMGLGIVMAAGAIGIKWENLQWLVAALSVGLGFGLQEIFGNFVSGIILLFERQLRVGDIITLNGLSGTVSKIRIRSTTIISFENKEVMIPNREFITSALTNWSLTSTVTKLEFVVGVAYDADVEKAKNLLRNIIYRCRYISKEHASLIYVSELAASSVNITVEVYVNAIGDRKLTMDYLSRETLSTFAQNGIEIPFNQMDLHVRTLEKQEFIDQLRRGLFEKNGGDKEPVLESK
ncbi:MAG: mechanosensitive ion channel [Succinatimonas sp.]|nr:mechanosensitive ion channel [Succinatimonas sp.]MDD5868698.1 mechanosensitive ion channel [Succinatimonas sp.]MDY5723086.1 mechanosensitive ion channel [Succinivibrio sp.]